MKPGSNTPILGSNNPPILGISPSYVSCVVISATLFLSISSGENKLNCIPTTLSILTFIIYIITHDKFLFYLAFGMVVIQYFVKSIKNIFSYFYSIFISSNNKNINLPILGRFSRPEGATNCGTYLVYPDKPATSYGMPSGHSEINWYFITYIILDILYTSLT